MPSGRICSKNDEREHKKVKENRDFWGWLNKISKFIRVISHVNKIPSCDLNLCKKRGKKLQLKLLCLKWDQTYWSTYINGHNLLLSELTNTHYPRNFLGWGTRSSIKSTPCIQNTQKERLHLLLCLNSFQHTPVRFVRKQYTDCGLSNEKILENSWSGCFLKTHKWLDEPSNDYFLTNHENSSKIEFEIENVVFVLWLNWDSKYCEHVALSSHSRRSIWMECRFNGFSKSTS